MNINGGNINFYGTGSATIYAPTGPGTANQLLFGNAKGSPTWVDIGMSIDANKNLLFCEKPTNIKFGTNINVKADTTNNITTYTISAIATTEATTYSAGIGLTLDDDNKFNLLPATENSLGGIQLGYENADKKYAVKVDSTTNKAYVEVPW
jgi:hypothetical protein